jgi:hypothetical protein
MEKQGSGHVVQITTSLVDHVIVRIGRPRPYAGPASPCPQGQSERPNARRCTRQFRTTPGRDFRAPAADCPARARPPASRQGGGTESSNLLCSSSESGANLNFDPARPFAGCRWRSVTVKSGGRRNRTIDPSSSAGMNQRRSASNHPDERPIAQPWSCNSSPLAWSPFARLT